MASVETKQMESNMVTTMETKQSEDTGVITTAEMEMSDYKRCKVTRAETKAIMPKKLITSLGFFLSHQWKWMRAVQSSSISIWTVQL